jgi:GNAT superfamily N-acetyltransferase
VTEGAARPAPAPPLIRHATPDDLDGIVEVYLASARHHAALDPVAYRVPEVEAVRSRFAHELAHLDRSEIQLVAVLEGRVVGHADASPAIGGRPSMRVPSRTAQVGIAVIDEWRGLGLGTALMEAIEDWARATGLDALELDVATANEGARRLYERIGYRPASEHLVKRLATPADANEAPAPPQHG